MINKNKVPDPEALKLRMAGLCSRSEQCSFDILAKLRRAGLSKEKSEEIVRFLIDRRFISDRRFAAAFASSKVRLSAWGRYKVAAALRAKRIPEPLIREALDSIETSEYVGALRKAAFAKARSLNLTVKEDAVKLYRHLASRGFESALIVAQVKAIIKLSREDHAEGAD